MRHSQVTQTVGAYMQNRVIYYRTWNDGEQSTHLSSHGDSAICGMDLIGDPVVHDRPPLRLNGSNHRVTCSQCQSVIATVRAHLTRRVPDAGDSSQ